MRLRKNTKNWVGPKMKKFEKGGGCASKSPPPFLTIFEQKSQKGVKRGVQKWVAEKSVKLMGKACEKDAKMEAKIDDFFSLREKGAEAEKYLFYSKKRGFGGVKKCFFSDVTR